MYRREALLTASSLRLIDAVSQPTGMLHTTALYGRSGWGFPVPEQVSLDAWARFIKKQPAIVSVPRVSPPPPPLKIIPQARIPMASARYFWGS